jgi:hypothetical protein
MPRTKNRPPENLHYPVKIPCSRVKIPCSFTKIPCSVE